MYVEQRNTFHVFIMVKLFFIPKELLINNFSVHIADPTVYESFLIPYLNSVGQENKVANVVNTSCLSKTKRLLLVRKEMIKSTHDLPYILYEKSRKTSTVLMSCPQQVLWVLV